MRSCLTLLLVALQGFGVACSGEVVQRIANNLPRMTMRIRASDTESVETWRANFREIAAHPGCCDEIWFSTGCGAPTLKWHRANAAVLAEAIRDCREKGIVPSLQFQATLGHGDKFGTPGMFTMKKWTGWTGWSGIETKYCSCPRQSAFLAYLREVSRIYAPLGFAGLWVDDDLRIAHHQPSDSYGRRIGCWCATCLRAFNDETGAKWTREDLAVAVQKDDVLAASWRKFSIGGLLLVAHAVGEEFVRTAPGTMLALQHACDEESVDQVLAILKEFHAISGRFVGFRPGWGAYYDDNPNEVVLKSLRAGCFRNRIGDPGWIRIWTPEIESWPRTYYSRSPQGVLVEALTALMYGMNSVSFFISNGAMEDPALYGRTHWKALAVAAPVLQGYARAIERCKPVGFTMTGAAQIGIRRAAIPVLSGVGRSFGELTKDECALNVNMMTTAAVQKLRDDLDRRAGGLPAVVRSPFAGLLQIHVDAENHPMAVAIVNTRITAQGPVRVELRRVREDVGTVVWRALCHTPENLPIERIGDGFFVTIPSVDAWSGGFLDLSEDTEGNLSDSRFKGLSAGASTPCLAVRFPMDEQRAELGE